MPHIQLSDETLNRLKALAEPFVDLEPEDVIRRLLDKNYRETCSPTPFTSIGGPMTDMASTNPMERSIESRVPRERGVEVEIGKQRIRAVSVSDLYKQALTFLVQNHEAQLTQLLPFETSRERYLVADKPVHPSGRKFFITVEYHGYYMEAHKDYKNAIEHLRKLAKRLGLSFKYLG
jgi:hypothetical protein